MKSKQQPQQAQKRGNILLGLCGGIAAYKIPGLVSLLSQQGYRVRVVISEAAARFVSCEVLEILSGQTVYRSLWQKYEAAPNRSPVLHIALIEEADIFLLAPASYNWIGKAALGSADDLLSTLFAAWPLPKQKNGQSDAHRNASKPLLFAPAMNPEMWHKRILQKNIERLQEWGCELVAPNSGFLACRSEGRGRMAEIEEIYFRLESRLRFCEAPLQGKRLLISAGPTREAIDPVRYLSNRSSGRLGIAIACAARDMGAKVTLISGIRETQQSALPHLARLQSGYVLAQQLFGIHVLNCDSADQMALYAKEQFGHCDWAVAVAAVCDFCAAEPQQQKIKKPDQAESFVLQLRLTPDILAYWGRHKKAGQKVLGFALEHCPDAQDTEMSFALAKLHSKNADAILLNRPDNLEGDAAQGQLFFAAAKQAQILKRQSKSDFAAELLLRLCKQWL